MKSSKKEKSAPRATTMPMKLIQFLKAEVWLPVNGLFSGFIGRSEVKEIAGRQ